MNATTESNSATVEGTVDYEIRFESYPHRVRVVLNQEVIADSDHVVVLRETRHPPVYYFPREDVRMDFLVATDRHTHCPFRGNASYWTITVGDRTATNGAWSYEQPYDEAAEIRSYIAFYDEMMDAVYDEEQELRAKRGETVLVHKNPLVEWLISEAWNAPSSKDLVGQFARRLVNTGIPVSRLWLAIRTLHPLLFSIRYVWKRSDDTVDERHTEFGVLAMPEFLNSPLVPIFDGAGGVRRRLDIPEPQLDYPIVEDLYNEGATDYVAMPLLFSDGQINAISLTSEQPGGFTTQDLGHIYEILPLLSRLLEVHATHRTSMTLLETYLGKHTGDRVLKGQIKRGDGENIHAVIWFCDLRESTPLADSMSRDDFLGLLNKFFDCMGGAILQHGGEVLRFIGDAALAIFPIGSPQISGEEKRRSTKQACQNALTAVIDASSRMESLNKKRHERSRRPLEFGLALHVGDVTYGNIGTAKRLEFTVIGAAANEAARLESLCKTLNTSILISADFVHAFPGDYVSLGKHELRGVSEPKEVFTLTSDSLRATEG